MEKDEVLDTNVLIDGGRGTTTIFNIIEYPPAGKHCDILFPGRNDFKRAMDISWRLRNAGTPVGTVDILIASICINRGLKIITNDADFLHVRSVEPELKVARR